MTIKELHWLELSKPPEPIAKKAFETDDTPCPTCGWPVMMGAETCAHCGHAIAQAATVDMLAELNVQLSPPEVEITPPPEHWFNAFPGDNPAMYRLRLLAEQLHVTTGFDQLICLDDISVDHYQHQLEAALRALRDMRGRALLADEVGLGKTIEAGIVMKELVERGLVNSVLILTPASLTWQWHEEMETKFHETFTVLEKRSQLLSEADNSDNLPCRWIISLDRAKSTHWAGHLLAREYDLLLVDEAHKLKNQRTNVYKFVSQLRKRYVLMLTATPVHNNLMELYNLISILRPGHLGTRSVFRDNFVLSMGGPKYRVLSWTLACRTGFSVYLNSPANVRNPKYRFSYRHSLVVDIPDKDFTIDKLLALPAITPGGELEVTRNDIESFYTTRHALMQLLQQGYEVTHAWLVTFKKNRNAKHLENKLCGFRLELSLPDENGQNSSPVSQGKKPARHTVPRNPAALRELLRELMIRNRRSSVGVRFPLRQAAIYNLNLTPVERELYDGVTAFIREQLRQQATSGQSLGPLRMMLMTLQKQLCSSPQAVAGGLEKLVARDANPQLAGYLALAQSMDQGCKVQATLDILKSYPAKTLIFTDYLPTLYTLHDALLQAGIETVLFHGGLSALERVEVVRRFWDTAQVMISSQSGSEGHNLQFCHQLINYDLPWNPMRIEQRVGRLHRLGQKETVSIFNLSAADTIEAYILDLLAHKIRMFELVIGELDMILGEFDERQSFEQGIEHAWEASYSEAELQQMLAELEAMLDKAKKASDQIRASSNELSDLLEAMDEVYG